MNVYVGKGEVLKAVVTADVTSGSPISLGGTPGGFVAVPMTDGLIGDEVNCRIKEIVQLPLKTGGSDLGIGDTVHFNPTDGVYGGAESVVTGDVNNCGKVASSGSVAADTMIEILLTPESASKVA